MSSVNKVILVGNVGGNPDIRSTDGGNKVANFSLATGERWTDKRTGERRERTEWHKIGVFGEGAVNVIEQYVHKGSKLYVEGKLQTRKWTDRNGVDRYSTEIVVDGFSGRVVLLGDQGRNRQAAKPDESDAGDAAATDGAQPVAQSRFDLDDEIPFAPEWR